MPQLVPFFIYQVVFAFAIFVITVFIFSKYVLPRFVRLFARGELTSELNVIYDIIISKLNTSLFVLLLITPFIILLHIFELKLSYLLVICVSSLLSIFINCVFRDVAFPCKYRVTSIVLLSICLSLLVSPLLYTVLFVGMPWDIKFKFNFNFNFLNTFNYIFQQQHLSSDGSVLFADNSNGTQSTSHDEGASSTQNTSDKLQSLRKENEALKHQIYRIQGKINKEKEEALINVMTTKLALLLREKDSLCSQIDSLAKNTYSSTKNVQGNSYRTATQLVNRLFPSNR